MAKTAIMFSGGKDSMYALRRAKDRGCADLIIAVQSPRGETQLHLAPEVAPEARRAQIDLLDMPYREITIDSQENYLRKLLAGLKRIVYEEDLKCLVTGDLWHPYTEGLGDMLAAALNVSLWRPGKDVCPSPEGGRAYMKELISQQIEAVIVAVKKGVLSPDYVGKILDRATLEELSKESSDCAGEGGQYQSFVVDCPLMRRRIKFSRPIAVEEVPAREGRGTFYRMSTSFFSLE